MLEGHGLRLRPTMRARTHAAGGQSYRRVRCSVVWVDGVRSSRRTGSVSGRHCVTSAAVRGSRLSEPFRCLAGHVIHNGFQVTFRLFEDFELAVGARAGFHDLAHTIDGVAAAQFINDGID